MFSPLNKLAKSFHVPPRELRMILLVSFLFMVGALAYIWPNVSIVKMAYEFQNQKKFHRTLLQENRLLRLELESLRSLDRIQTIAENQLGMGQPKPAQFVTVFLK